MKKIIIIKEQKKRRKKQGKKINHMTKYGFTKQLNGGGNGRNQIEIKSNTEYD